MLGYYGDTKGFEIILSRIANNHETELLDHKTVRAYARCLLKVASEININFNAKSEIEFLLVALSASGLSHYDRAFLANCVLKLLEDNRQEKEEISDAF